MATSAEMIDYVCEQVAPYGDVRSKKMFGEYLVYLNDRPILTVCDNLVFVNQLPQLEALMQDAPRGFPYGGAKEHYILDPEDRPLLDRLIPLLAQLIPVPLKRAKKQPL